MMWNQGKILSTFVFDATGSLVCSASSEELAAQIVKDHNAGDAARTEAAKCGLTEDQADAIREDRMIEALYHIECARAGVPGDWNNTTEEYRNKLRLRVRA